MADEDMPDKADLPARPGRVAPQAVRRRASPAGLGQARRAVRRRTRRRRFFPCRRCRWRAAICRRGLRFEVRRNCHSSSTSTALWCGVLLLIATLCMLPPLRSSSMAAGGAFFPIQPKPAPLVFPRLPNQPRVLLVFGGVDLPSSARAPTLTAAATRPMCRRQRGWKPARGEVVRWRAAERTPALLRAALLSMGLGLGCAGGCGVSGEM